MSPRLRAWLLILLIAAICGVSLWAVVWHRSRALSPAALLKRMPVEDALVAYINFSELRRAGILQLLDSAKAGEDPEYQRFVRKTEFDYKQDLDTALVAFAPTGKYMLLKGRFDWRSLHAYVTSEDGRCNNLLCRMAGSTPERRISFFPVQSALMALAVSPDESAALRMNEVASGPDPEVPPAPCGSPSPSRS